MAPVCPSFDSEETDPAHFFDGHSVNWKRHYIGWGISGACALIATVISIRLIYKHAKNYNKPAEQRHIMRIVLMIPIYSIISFLSYRFYKSAIYYETIRDCYEAFVIYSFFILLLTYLGDDHAARKAKITGPERRKLVFPLNCFYYNPLSDMFLHYMKYGILQYVLIKPLTTIAAVVLQYYGLYCETTWSVHFGKIYIMFVNFISVTVAMYCLVVLYVTIKTEIQEQKPFLKFLCVKLVIFFCFWQTVLLSILGHFNVFQATEYWSVSNIEIGISALLICIEMVAFAILHVYSFSYAPYVVGDTTTPVSKSLRDGFNPIDMVREVGWGFKDIYLLIRGKPIPLRDGHLSGSLNRANTIRAKRTKRTKGSNNAIENGNDGGNGTNGVSLAALESGMGTGGNKTELSDDGDYYSNTYQMHQHQQHQTPLLSQMDGRHSSPGSYEMHPSPAPQQEAQLQQQQQQQQEHQQYQDNLQQQQYQQQLYSSRPADGYY